MALTEVFTTFGVHIFAFSFGFAKILVALTTKRTVESQLADMNFTQQVRDNVVEHAPRIVRWSECRGGAFFAPFAALVVALGQAVTASDVKTVAIVGLILVAVIPLVGVIEQQIHLRWFYSSSGWAARRYLPDILTLAIGQIIVIGSVIVSLTAL